MKKVFIFCFIFLFLFASLYPVSTAVELDSVVDQVGAAQEKIDNVKDLADSPDKDKIAADYLKKEWSKILETKPIFKEIIAVYRKISPYTNPIILWLVGMTPALSWLFFLVMIIWYNLISFSMGFYEALSDFSTFSKRTSAVIYMCLMAILFVLKVIQNASIVLANAIIKLLTITFNTWWGQTLLVGGTVLLFFLLNMFSKKFRVYLRAVRLKRYKESIKNSAIEGKQTVKEGREELGKLSSLFDVVKDAFK